MQAKCEDAHNASDESAPTYPRVDPRRTQPRKSGYAVANALRCRNRGSRDDYRRRRPTAPPTALGVHGSGCGRCRAGRSGPTCVRGGGAVRDFGRRQRASTGDRLRSRHVPGAQDHQHAVQLDLPRRAEHPVQQSEDRDVRHRSQPMRGRQLEGPRRHLAVLQMGVHQWPSQQPLRGQMQLFGLRRPAEQACCPHGQRCQCHEPQGDLDGALWRRRHHHRLRRPLQAHHGQLMDGSRLRRHGHSHHHRRADGRPRLPCSSARRQHHWRKRLVAVRNRHAKGRA